MILRNVLAIDKQGQGEKIVSALKAQGYCYIPFREKVYNLNLQEKEVEIEEYIQLLGSLLYLTDVKAKTDSRSLVTSNRSLGFHTDHSKARYIMWYCVKQAVEGGETMLLDAYSIYQQLPSEYQEQLQNIYLFEHDVFDDDKNIYPLVSFDDESKLKIYYSFWLLNKEYREHPAVMYWERLIHQSQPIRFLLQPGDILIIDNQRMLHARTAFEGNRHLKRYWIINDITLNSKNMNNLVLEAEKNNFPEPITVERVKFLEEEKRIDPVIACINLEMIKMKLQQTENGEGWTPEQCDTGEVEYKRYLQLCKLYGKGIVPNKIIDTFWHYHILDTRAYAEDCQKIFGHFLHHYPYFGMRNEQEAEEIKQAFERTKELYLETFGESMTRGGKEMDCWHDCEDRCWHDCSSSK